jgi:hypothetical protein
MNIYSFTLLSLLPFIIFAFIILYKRDDSERDLSSDMETIEEKYTMVTRDSTSIFWLAPIIILAIGILPMPYGYYTLSRLVVSACSIYFAYKLKKNNDEPFMLVFGFVAILYNPIYPVHLNEKSIWVVVNILTSFLFFTKRKELNLHDQNNTKKTKK